MKTTDFDVIVVGGGPAGSTVATFIAMQDHRVLLLEKESFPFYKIGESLLPATVHGICPLLGVSDALEKAGFTRKLGGTFQWGKNPEPWTFLFAASPMMVGPTSTAYQVERMKFDLILLDNAREKGVDVRERHCAVGVTQDGEEISGLRVQDHRGREKTYHARYIVDASGHESILARHLGQRIYSKFFQNVALFGYYKNGGRLPAPNQGNIFSVAFRQGWFWYIPLSAELTSVGAVIDKGHAGKIGQGLEAAMNEFINECPPISRLLSSASRVTEGPYGKLRVRKDYSYSHSRSWGNGMVLVGDSACFVDPVFSSGVHLATYSALLAARSINTALKGGISETRCFDEFEWRYRREFRHFYEFLLAFYDVNQDTESYYWEARKVLNSQERNNEAFINLVAGLGMNEVSLMTSSADEFMVRRQGIGDALFPAGAEDLASIRADDFTRQEFYNRLTSEIVQVQTQAKLTEKRPREVPLRPGGLVPSPDGLHWSEPD